MLAPDAELGLGGDALDLLAHLVERGIDAVALGLDILGDGMLDGDARLVIDGVARCHAVDELQARHAHRRGRLRARRCRAARIGQVGIGDQLAQHHGDGLQGFDLDIVIFMGIGMLNAQHAHRTFASDDRNAGEAVEFLLAGFGLVGEIGVRRRLVEVERLDFLRDRADQPLAQRQLGDVHRLLRQPARGKELEHALAQQVDRADLARHRFADDLDH